jgi:nucleoside-diphosphate-sugar epimerase
VPATVFLAGAAGAVGSRLVPLLLDAGYQVVGTTRSSERADALSAAGVEPVVVDVYDAPALTRAMVAARPQIVIHQLTDLPREASRIPERLAGNSRIRSVGTCNLVAAAIEAGVSRLIAQSVAWFYAPGPEPHSEDDLLDVHAEGARAVTVSGVVALETLTLESPPLRGIVLRYGQLYGPGTGRDAPAGTVPLHVDCAASAALLATRYARTGVFNIAEANPHVSADKARRDLGWSPDFRLPDVSASHSPIDRGASVMPISSAAAH